MVGEVKINGKTYLDTNLTNLQLYLVEAVKELAAPLSNLAAKVEGLTKKYLSHDEKIQALEKKSIEQQKQIKALEAEVEELRKRANPKSKPES